MKIFLYFRDEGSIVLLYLNGWSLKADPDSHVENSVVLSSHWLR